MKRGLIGGAIVLLMAAAGFAAFVWPTLWRYDTLERMGGGQAMVRTHRLTGEVQTLSAKLGWVSTRNSYDHVWSAVDAAKPTPSTTDAAPTPSPTPTPYVETRGERAERRYQEGRAAFLAQDLENATTHFFAATNELPTDAQYRYALGLAYWHRNMRPQAEEAFRIAVQLDPSHAKAREYLERVRSSHVRVTIH